MLIEVASFICAGGFTIEVRADPDVEFALEFFAVGIGGYHVRGSFVGVLSDAGRFAGFREVPFSLLEVGITTVRLGEGASRRDVAPLAHRFSVDGPFEANRVPDGPVSIGAPQE